MRREKIVTGEYFHIYNRGVDKRDIFLDTQDLERFKESIIEFNTFENIGSLRDKPRTEAKPLELEKNEPIVAIVAFTLNPNHYHFILKQLIDGGIAKFMHKLGGYTYYFNDRHKRSGSLFQGTFKSKLIDDQSYFDKIFPYVNQNYLVHDIPENKKHLIFSSNKEYDNEVFDFVAQTEGRRILSMFDSKMKFNKHCTEIISIIRKERRKISLEDPDDLPINPVV